MLTNVIYTKWKKKQVTIPFSTIQEFMCYMKVDFFTLFDINQEMHPFMSILLSWDHFLDGNEY